jgi:Zn ribbon nucleic-acid-binding protein
MSESQHLEELPSRQQCPECRTRDTEKNFVEEYYDCLEEHRRCLYCGVEYTLQYENPKVLQREANK